VFQRAPRRHQSAYRRGAADTAGTPEEWLYSSYIMPRVNANRLARAAIDLLSSVLEMRRQEQSQAVPPAQYEMPAPVIAVTDPADVPLARLGRY
jgi:hypothetical protein